MKNPKFSVSLAVFILLGFASSMAFAEKPARKHFGKGNPFTLEELPEGNLKTKLKTLDPQARGNAMKWLHTFNFPAIDAVESLGADKEGGIYYSCGFSCAGCKSGEHDKSTHDDTPSDTSGAPEADSTETTEPTSNSKDALEPNTENGLPLEDNTASWTPSGPVSFINPPVFSSKPGAPNVIYLDFNGGIVTGTAWNDTVASFDTLAWSIDGDRTTFSNTEQTQIRQIWERMSEDYAPFDVNVTTDKAYDPDIYTGNRSRVGWCLFTPVKDRSGVSNPHDGYGGIAYVNVFGNANYAYNSPAWNIDYQQKDAAEVGSHEMGHNMGLSHDAGGGSTGGYYGGHTGAGAPTWGPIMGTGYGRNVSQWSKGDYNTASQTQDDLAIINAKTPYRTDDYNGTTNATATAITAAGNGSFSRTGIIERTNDVDIFSFATGAGSVTINANTLRINSADIGNTWGGNLDVNLELYNSGGTLVASNNSPTDTHAAITTTLAAGTYFIHVKPSAAGNASGTGSPYDATSSTRAGYTVYASLGQYAISGTFVLPGVNITEAGGTNVTEGGATDTYTIKLGTAPTANVTVSITPTAQVTTSVSSVVFTTSNWNTEQTVTVTAVNDTTIEGNHTGTITHTTSSGDPIFNNASVASIVANVTDNDNIDLISPNGGESWMASSTHTITWTSLMGGNVRIELLKNGVLDSTIIASTPNDGTHSWTIPTGQTPAADYRLRITSVETPASSDTSAANFTIAAIPSTIASQNFDPSASLPTGWTNNTGSGTAAWVITTAASHSPTRSAFTPAPGAVSSAQLTSESMAIPAGTTDIQLTFYQNYNFEDGWDGGTLEFSIDNGAWFNVTSGSSGASFGQNGYNLGGLPSNYSNPLGGQPAWTGNSGGWVQTIVNLTDSAKYAGKSLRARWVIGTDSSSGTTGWYVDTVVLQGVSSQGMLVTSGNLSSTGNYGGSFTPSSTLYTITNIGTSSINWTAAKTASWVTLSSTGGTLAASASANVTVSINSGANTLAAGSYTDTVTFTNTSSGFGNTTRAVNLTVSKANQTITFGTLSPVLDNTVLFALTGSASSGLTVAYTSSNTAVATVSGSTVTVVGLGDTTITASQAGNANYNAATSVARTLSVVRSNPLAVTGGPYKLYVNGSLALNGSGSFPSYGTTISSYTWDLDNNGTYGDVTGASPAAINVATLMSTWGMTQGLNTIQLRITDSSGKVSTVATTVELALALTWDQNGVTSGQTNGGGVWLNANQWWDGTVNLNWVAGSNAIFGGPSTAGGAVTLASPTSLESLTFNTFTGTYTLGTVTQTLTLKSGITNNPTAAAVVIVSPLTLSGNQTWNNNSSSALRFGNATTGGADTPFVNGGYTLTADGAGQTQIYGSMSGAGGIIKNGAGMLNLGGLNVPTLVSHIYSGNTTINAGTLQIQGTAGVGTGNLNIANGVLQLYNGGAFTRDLGTGANQIQITGGVSGFSVSSTTSSTFSITGTDPLVWGSTAFRPTELLLLSGDLSTAINAKLTLTSNINLNGANRTITSQQTGGDLVGGIATMSGVISNSSGSAALIKNGPGLIALSGANTYNGGTTINAGVLRFTNVASMPAAGTVTVSNGATLGVGFGGAGEWTTATSGNGSLGGLFSGLGGQSGSSLSYSGNVMVNIHNAANAAYTGNIPNAGTTLGLVKTGNSTLTLSGNSSFAGPVAVYQGTLSVNSIGSVGGGNSALGAPTTAANGTISLGNAITSTGTLVYTGPGETTNRIINLSGFNQGATITHSGSGLLKFTSAITASSLGTDNRKTLTLNGSTTGLGEFAGAIIDNAASTNFTTAVTKNGTGTWILSGANTYTGNTSVSQGKLFVNGSIGNSLVTVSNTASLGGSGSIGGNVTVNAGGNLEFNISTNVAGHSALDLAAGKTLTFVAPGATPQAITITSAGGAATGTYVLMSAPGGITGALPTVLNLPVGWTATAAISGTNLVLNVTAVNNNQGALTVAAAGGMTFTGYTGGPFNPTPQTYTLNNPGGTALNWTAGISQGWLTVTPTSGTIAAGGSATVTVSIGAGGNTLLAGSYGDVITFNNTTNNAGTTTRAVSLTVNNRVTSIVTFDSNGGTTPSPTSKSVDLDYAYGTLPTVTRAGYTFAGWFAATTGGSQVLSTTVVSSSVNHTLYARWAGINVAESGGTTVVTENAGTDTFTVVLNSEPTANVVVSVVSTADATVSPATLTFTTTNWSTPQTVTVTGVNDDYDRNDTATITITTTDATTLDTNYDPVAGPNVTATCTDDDTAGFIIGAISGNTAEPNTTAIFSFRLTAQPTANVVIPFSSSDTTEGTVTPSLTFTNATNNWSTNQTVTVTGVNDTIVDGNIAYTIISAAATSTDLAFNGLNPADVAVINNDNDYPTVAVTTSGAAVTEVDPTTGIFTFTRSSDIVRNAVTVFYTVSGTASANADYQALNGSVVIPAGQDTATVTLIPIDDNVTEVPETLIVTITANASYVVATAPANAASLTILDDTEAVAVNISSADANASEPAKGDGVATFTITRSGSTTAALSVNILAAGTATQGSDYTNLPAAVTIPAGQPSAIFTVTPTDDSVAEIDETIIINLLVGSGYSVGATPSATLNLFDDEPTEVLVEVSDALCTEAASVGPGAFTLRRLGNRTAALTVNYTVSGTATSGSDYTALTGTAAIGANAPASAAVTVTPINDALVEGTETVILTLATGTGYAINAQNSGTLEIRDDETVDVSLSVFDLNCAEQATPDTGAFRITRSATAATPLNVTYTIIGTAANGTDYTTLTGTATILANATTVDILITPTNDGVLEGSESVIMTLTGGGATYDVGDARTATIWINDDETPSITLAATDNSASEGTPVNNGLYTFTSSIAPASNLTINYTVSTNNGIDCEFLPGSIVLLAGQTSVTLPVVPIDDELVEAAENITVTLAYGGSYNLTTTTGINVSIAASDTPTASIVAFDANATENPVDTGRFIVTLNKVVAGNTNVTYTVNGTATSASDFTALTGTVTVSAGANSAIITVTPLDDGLSEGPESVIVTLTAAASYTLASPSVASVTISDDEPAPGTYAVTYNANAATSGTIPSAQTKNHNVSLILQNNTGTLARTGYAFVGWNTQPDGLGTDYAVASNYTVNAAVILFAKWTTISNTAPTITNIADSSTNEDIATSAIAFTVGDAETAAASLTVSGTSSNLTLVPNANIVLGGSGANRTVTVTPVANLSGTSTITVTVSDGTATTSDTFVLTVNAVNDLPTISNIADTSTNEDTATSAIAFTIGDAETAATSLTVTRTSSNLTLVPVANVVLGGTDANRTVTVTPVANLSGTSTITVTVSDGTATTSDTFVLTVNAVNDLPTISNIADTSTNEDTATSAVAFTIGDVETAVASLTVSGTSSNLTLVPNANIVFGGSGSNRTVTVTPVANLSGTSTITVTVSDGTATTSDTFVLTVTAVNDLPTISNIADQSTTTGVAVSNIPFTVGDVETAVASLTLSGSSSNTTLLPNANIVFGGSGASRTVTVTPAAGQTGTSTITVTVNDGTANVTDTFVLTVNSTPNTAPTISNIADTSTNEDTATSAIAFTIGDAETAATSLTVSGTSSNLTLVPNANIVFGGSGASRTVTVTPVANLSGTSTITVTVSDSALTATDTFVLTVNAVNDAPTITNIADSSTNEDTATSAIAFTIGDVETAATSLTVTRTSSNLTLVPLANVVLGGTDANRTVTVTPAANQSGTSTITVSVSDGTATTSDTFVLTVTAVNDLPTITNIADQSTTTGVAVSNIPFTVGDVETAVTSLTVSGASSNTTLLPNANIVFGGSGASRTVTVTPAAAQTGTATVTVTVSDGTLTATDTFVLTVTAPANTFASWISGFSGLNGLTAFNDDADGDGIANGLEAFFGTAPNARSSGLSAVAFTGSALTLTHPETASQLSDVTGSYEWSLDLSAWNTSGATINGTTVTIGAAQNTPAPGTTTVTATVTGTSPGRIFVRAKATQN